MRKYASMAERLSAFYVVNKEGCWEWAGSLDRGGYGRLNVGGRRLKAHRVSYELRHGPILEGLYVCHSCDNRKCINPSHLWLGNARDNIKDAIAKGRIKGGNDLGKYQIGEENPNSRLRVSDVVEIRSLVAMGEKHREVAERYSITRQLVTNIVNRKRWASVD